MPRIGERGWVHSGVKVYDNADAPTSWTDLDLSAVVGARHVLAALKLKNRDASYKLIYLFRRNGETEDVADAYGLAGMNNTVDLAAGKIVHFVLETDENGIIEWKTSQAEKADIWVLGYIR